MTAKEGPSSASDSRGTEGGYAQGSWIGVLHGRGGCGAGGGCLDAAVTADDVVHAPLPHDRVVLRLVSSSRGRDGYEMGMGWAGKAAGVNNGEPPAQSAHVAVSETYCAQLAQKLQPCGRSS